jgi:hypothetical protein
MCTTCSITTSFGFRAARTLAVLIVLACIGGLASGDELEELREQSRVSWNKFFEKNCSNGMSEQAVRKLMDRKYRNLAVARANDEIYRLLYVIDDFHEVEFAFRNNATLLMPPTVERKGKWIRSSDGKTISIPEPAEAALKSKLEAAGIQYVAKKEKYQPEQLTAHASRGKKHRWNVVVMLNSLVVDTPNYVLELTDDGQVTEPLR